MSRFLNMPLSGPLTGKGGESHLDLTKLTYVDSTGMKTLVSLHNCVESLGRRLVIVSPTRPVLRVLAVVGSTKRSTFDRRRYRQSLGSYAHTWGCLTFARV